MSVRETHKPPHRPYDLRAPYSGYHLRELPPEDGKLTHSGPGTPCGEYMRRFWQPGCVSQELSDLPLTA